MKKLFILTMSGVAIALLSLKPITSVKWTVDKMHARVGFSITHNMTSDVEGHFKFFDATIVTIGEDFADAVFDFTASANSITTNNDRRDKHIVSADFLDAENFPELNFRSVSVVRKSSFSYEITGDLTLHGVTKRIVLQAAVRIPPAAAGLTKAVAGFKVSGAIQRSDFNIGGAFANIMLGDEIAITVNGEFIRN